MNNVLLKNYERAFNILLGRDTTAVRQPKVRKYRNIPDQVEVRYMHWESGDAQVMFYLWNSDAQPGKEVSRLQDKTNWQIGWGFIASEYSICANCAGSGMFQNNPLTICFSCGATGHVHRDIGQVWFWEKGSGGEICHGTLGDLRKAVVEYEATQLPLQPLGHLPFHPKAVERMHTDFIFTIAELTALTEQEFLSFPSSTEKLVKHVVEVLGKHGLSFKVNIPENGKADVDILDE